MERLPDLKWITAHDYCGKILFGQYSTPLKRRVSEYVLRYHAFDQAVTPVIPYISAWHTDSSTIWYEYAGKNLRRLLDCPDGDLAAVFRKRIIDRYVYKRPSINRPVARETIHQPDLRQLRPQLRRQQEAEGFVNAVYKVAIGADSFCWLKDQAVVESYPRDRLCLSHGVLVDVTNEMVAERELDKIQRQLLQHRQDFEAAVRDRTKKLWNSQMEVVVRLARAAEFRDNRTGRHLTKISRYCAVVSEAAGLPRVARRILSLAAPMHDIGKIGISDAILRKPGRLTEAEFEQMKNHCHIGAQLLRGEESDVLRVARAIALSHHERWDGTGYPRRLGGRAIPLAARITAICDVFDALTSKRPYKPAWPVDKAVAEIHRGRGRHFDPELVDVFIANLPKIKKIYHTYQEH